MDIFKFNEIFDDDTHNVTKIPKNQYKKSGIIPIIDQGKEFIAGYTDYCKSKKIESTRIIFGDHTRIIKLIDFKACIGADGVKVLKIKNKNADYKYMYYYLKKSYIPDTGYNRHFKWLKELKFTLPLIEEQKTISAKLDKVQEIIDIRQEQIKGLDQVIKSKFNEMFGNVNDNKNNYEIKTLNEIFEFIKDGTHSTPTYTDDKINGVKFLSAKDVTTGTINWDNIKYIPLELHNQLIKRVKPQKNDILLAKNGTTGICAKVDRDDIFDIYVSLALLRPKKGYLVEYLVQAINNDVTKEQFDKNLKGVGVPNLHLREIQKVKIVVPPIELQNEFAEIVKQINKQKVILQKSLEEMQKLQESLMNKYFGG